MNNDYGDILNKLSDEISLVKSGLISSLKDCPYINDDLLELISAPSKFLRSVLCIFYMKSYGIEITEKHIDLLVAVELVHNASLIHDDTIDEAEIRRSIQTLNTKFSSKLAVLAGDYVLSVAMQKIIALNSNEILLNFAKTLQFMTEAELTQYFNKFEIPTLEDYIKKSENKTAKLFETALTSCMILSGTDYKNAGEFAKNFGIAFQIKDDLMNAIGKIDGKPVNSDMQSGIYTASAIFAEGNNIDNSAIEKTKSLMNNYMEYALNYVTDKPFIYNLMRIIFEC